MFRGIGGEVGFWCPSFDDRRVNSLVTYDITSNNNDATLRNMEIADWVADTSNGGIRALEFDGINEDILITNSNILNPSTAISLSCWIKLNVNLETLSNFVNLFAKEDFAGNLGYYLGFRTDIANDPLTFRINGSITQDLINWNPGTYFNDLQWHHICATYNKSQMILYVDAIVRATASYSTDIAVNTSNLAAFTRLNGRADDLRIFDRALNTTEVISIGSRRGYVPRYFGTRRYGRGYGT